MYMYLHVHGIVRQSLDGLKQSITLELQRNRYFALCRGFAFGVIDIWIQDCHRHE